MRPLSGVGVGVSVGWGAGGVAARGSCGGGSCAGGWFPLNRCNRGRNRWPGEGGAPRAVRL